MRDDILNLRNTKRIAIMGGTFDPIHYGHLVTAEAVRHEYNIERVLFVPAGQPAYKKAEQVSHSEHRYLMTVLATAANPAFHVSRTEIDREGVTYTIDTIKQLKRLCGKDTKIYFITGADAVHQILSWKKSEELLKLCSFIAVTRPGYNTQTLREHVASIKQKYETRLHFLEVPALAISSSDIRKRVGAGKPATYLLPAEVERYILKTGLYQHEGTSVLLAGIEAHVKARLTESRYLHTKGVVAEAQRLAAHYGADAGKAALAAWLHDSTRYFTNAEAKRFCKERDVKPDAVMKRNPRLLHGQTAAMAAEETFGIKDADVLAAIRFHTTGRAGMGLLEKIIFIADMIELGREAFPELADIRALAYTDLDLAMELGLECGMAYAAAQHDEVHGLSAEALADIRGIRSRKTEDDK